jgi:beta-glucanase (GH16 family)
MSYRLCGACLNFARHDERECPFCGRDMSTNSWGSRAAGAAMVVGVGLALAACGGTAIDGGFTTDAGPQVGTAGTGGTGGLYGGPPGFGGVAGQPAAGGSPGAGGVYGGPAFVGGAAGTGGAGGYGGMGGTPPLLGGAPGTGGVYGGPPLVDGGTLFDSRYNYPDDGIDVGPDACVSETDAALCARLFRCGQIWAIDNCGRSREAVSCGGCDAGGGDAGAHCPDVLGHPSSPCNAYPTHPGFTLKLVEDFDSPLDLATDPIWTYSDGHSGQVRFVKDAISFQSGKAIITVSSSSVPASPSYADAMKASYPYPAAAQPLSSGELRTKYNNLRYGRYEFRVKPPATGSTSATEPGNFFSGPTLSRTPNWQEWREIDIWVTPDHQQQVDTGVVYGDDQLGLGPSMYDYSYQPAVPSPAINQTDFHTYAVEWTPAAIVYSIDGTVIRTHASTEAVKIPDKSVKIMMNTWIWYAEGTTGGHYPANNVYPMHSEIDWVRFYRWDQEATYPCSPVPYCLPNADRDYSKNNSEDGIPTTATGL